jgi:hypothetical protein
MVVESYIVEQTAINLGRSTGGIIAMVATRPDVSPLSLIVSFASQIQTSSSVFNSLPPWSLILWSLLPRLR